MIVSFLQKFPCSECTWIHSKPPTFTFSKFRVQNRTIFVCDKIEYLFVNFRFLLSRRNLSGNFTVFWNNRQLIGSCLYSLVLARDLFFRRLSPLVDRVPLDKFCELHWILKFALTCIQLLEFAIFENDKKRGSIQMPKTFGKGPRNLIYLYIVKCCPFPGSPESLAYLCHR